MIWDMFNFNKVVNELTKLEFTNYAEYKEWQVNWRHTYKVLTKEIRLNTEFFKLLQKKIVIVRKDTNWGPYFEPRIDNSLLLFNKQYHTIDGQIFRLKNNARVLMALLSKAKNKKKTLKN